MAIRSANGAAPDTIEVSEVVRTLRQQWRAVFAFIALGVVGALAVILFAPREYDGRASVLARTSSGGSASVLGRMTGIGELLGGAGGLGGASSLETELQMLKSRALAGHVVDSLLLQAQPIEPARLPPAAFVSHYRLQPSFSPRTYEFVRGSDGRYHLGDSDSIATPGQPFALDIGSITLRQSGLPSEFTLRLLDREDAITRFGKQLEVTKAGGEIAKIVYEGSDSITAAAAPNALIAFYLERRRTVDRGTNQRRVEYVQAQVDSAAAQLAQAERELRQSQERSGIYDAEITDVTQLESAAKLRESLIELQVDDASLDMLLAEADRGTLTSRDLAAYPGFIRGSAVSPLVTQLTELEIQRNRLLDRRTERDPEVMALDNSIRTVNATIVGLARSYSSATKRQKNDFQTKLDSLDRRIQALPAAAERVGRLQRDVLRLTQLYTALQAQLVEARLGAITEGGDVRQIDFAVTPRGPSFPQPFLTMGLGVGGGLVAGLVAALFLGWFGRWLRDPIEVERAVGITAERLGPDAPLLLGGTAAQRTLLVVPLDDRARSLPVVERLARTATARSLPVNVLDLSGHGKGSGGNGELSVARNIEQYEQQDGMLIVQLPSLSSDAAVAALRESRPVLLVAGPGPIDRSRLAGAVETLRRVNAPCAGIIMSDARDTSPIT